MDQRLSELLASLRERFDPRAAPDDEVRAFLAAEGCEERRIGEVLALFRGDSSPASGAVRASRGAAARGSNAIQDAVLFRVQGPHERGRFSPEAWGHLLSLSGAGVLSGAELEHVIERALTHIDGRIALDDLRSLLEAVGDGDGSSGAGRATIH